MTGVFMLPPSSGKGPYWRPEDDLSWREILVILAISILVTVAIVFGGGYLASAAAVPALPLIDQVWLTAPACGWSAQLRGSPGSPGSYAPACAGLVVMANLSPGTPSTLDTTLTQYATPALTLSEAVFGPQTEVFRDERVTTGGTESIALPAPGGTSHLWLWLNALYDPIFLSSSTGTLADGTPVLLSVFDAGRGVGYYFDLTYAGDEAPEQAAEPATLLLVGSALALLGWRVRRRR